MSYLFDPYGYQNRFAVEHAARAQHRAETIGFQADALERRVEFLEEWLDRMCLGMTAMTDLLEERGITKEMLDAKVQEIDMRDGVADGKITRTRTDCPQCHRTNGGRRANCLYCGAPLVV